MATSYHETIEKLLESKGCKLIEFVSKSVPMTYICRCGEQKKKLYKDYIKRGCRSCNIKALKEAKTEHDDSDGQIWKPVPGGGFISSWGNAKNNNGMILKLCPTKFRYFIGGKNQYASRLVATAFQLENYEKLEEGQTYVVSHIDGDPTNNRVENLVVHAKADVGKINGLKARKSAMYNEKQSWEITKFANLENRIIPELPNHIIYENGEICNGNRFMTFSKSEGYLNLCVNKKTYKVHRLVCYAFNPLPGKECLKDYDNEQVNHKNAIKTDHRACNLEWCSQSENLLHAYANKLNSRSRSVAQWLDAARRGVDG